MSIVRRLGILLLLGFVTGCQSTPPTGYDSAAETLFNVPHRVPDSMSAMPQIGPVERAFTAALAAAVAGDLKKAQREADAAGYLVLERKQNGRDFTILLEKDGAGIGPAIAIAKTPVRDAVIEAPHPVKDRDTDRQAAILFFEVGARALIIAGANRCAAWAESPCSGMTGICGGGRNPYRVSDPAHNTLTLFHVAHLYFTRAWPKSVVVQPHGFNNSGYKPWFVISDGTRESRPNGQGLPERVRDRINASLSRDDRAVSCQDPTDRDISTRWLCATTTVQGRHLNGSPDACRVASDKSSGRFLHIEQVHSEVRRPFARDWENLSTYPGSAAILNALTRELPCIRADCSPAS